MAAKDTGLATLKKEIQKKEMRTIYLLYGEEQYLKDYYAGRLKAVMPPDPLGDFNHIVMEGAHSIDEIDNAIEEYPVMAEKKIIELIDTGFFKKTSEEMSTFLKQRLADIPDYVLLIFREKEIDKRSAVYKAAVKNGLAVEFTYLNETELVNWVQRYVLEAQKKIDKNDAQYFVGLCDDGLVNIKNELDKLISYCGAVIERYDIDRLVSKSLNVRIFEMTDGIMEKNADKVMSILAEIKSIREPAFKVLYLLSSTFDKLLHSKLLGEEGASYGEIASKLGVSPYIAQKYAKSAAKFSKTFLIDRVRTVAEIDYMIKQGKAEDWAALERYITESVYKK